MRNMEKRWLRDIFYSVQADWTGPSLSAYRIIKYCVSWIIKDLIWMHRLIGTTAGCTCQNKTKKKKQKKIKTFSDVLVQLIVECYDIVLPYYIPKIYLYNVDPLKPHFYIVKLEFTGVDIIFLISAQNIDCGYSLEPPRRGGSNEYPQSVFWTEVWKISDLKILIFWW